MTAYTVSAGPVATSLHRWAFPGEDQSVLPQPADIAPEIAALREAGETRHGKAGFKASNAEMASLNIHPAGFHGEWNISHPPKVAWLAVDAPGRLCPISKGKWIESFAS